MPTQAVSFMIRFTLPRREALAAEQAAPAAQAGPAAWHGLVKHIQTGQERRFTDFAAAIVFMQQYLEEPDAGAPRAEASGDSIPPQP